ncbi:MAG: TerB family tellurite resistance protein [Flavobacteriaceae bacterium]
MNSFEEKLSIMAEMIAFARADDIITDSEYFFLLSVAEQLGIDKDTFESLFENEVEKIIPKTQAERILQFHRLVLLMNVDEQHDSEVNKLRNIGLGMGLPPGAIEQVLSIMHQYPNKIVPPNVLINIFKAHYN